MNIHPLFVHFPIGILTLYTLFELLRIKFVTKQPYYFQLKAVLVIFGTLAAFAAASTGDMAEELAEAGKNTVVSAADMPVIDTHAMFAMATVWIFAVLAGSYLFEFLRRQKVLKILTNLTWLQKTSHLIQRASMLLAIAGMITMTITGALGASLVYGPEIDPAVGFIYNLIIVN